MKGTVAVFGAVLSVVGSAAPLYTNTWVNAAGVGVTNRYGDAANWRVAYESGMTPPASSVPTADSRTFLTRDASVALEAGDDFHLGETFFLAAGTRHKTLNLTIPQGASLSLDGASLASHMGTSSWVEQGVGNRAAIDVDGGTLVLGQEVFNVHGNTQANWTDVPVNRLVVRNGGVLSVTNGSLRLWGGSSADSQGRGLYTNIVDVLAGSTIELRGKGSIAMGGEIDFVSPHAKQPYYGAGWLNVKGGEIVARGSASPCPIYMAVSGRSGIGAYLNVTDGGKVDLDGRALYVQSQGTNIVRVASGGVISNFSYAVESGGANKESYHNLVDIDGGKVYADQVKQITADPSNRGTWARTTFRLHGGDATLDVWKWNLAGKYASEKVPPFFNDMRLKAHTDRDADFAVRPIRTRLAVWDGDNGGGVNAYVHGYWRLSPDGGFQLVHKDRFELLCRKHDDQGAYKTDSRYGGFIGEDMWKTNIATLCENRWKDYATYEYVYVYRVLLKDEAELADGVALAVPRPRGWLRLPTFTEHEVNVGNTERISVRLALVAPTGRTLDLDRIVRNLRDNGYPNACADASVAGYNVRVDLPLGELKAGTTEDRIVMDFVSCETYGQAAGCQALTTNALIRAATCERVACPETARAWPRLMGTMLGQTTEREFRDLARMRASLVRYQMTESWSKFAAKADSIAAFDSWIDGKLDHLAEMLPWARKYGIRICVDLHTAIGGFTDETYNSHMIFVEKRYEDALVATWEKIARRFKGNWDVLYGYDLLNEPIDRENALTRTTWRAVASRTIEAIRAIDAAAVIVYEPNCNASPRGFDIRNIYGLKGFEPLPYDNLIYSVHVYQPMDFTHQGLSQKKEDYTPVPYPNEKKGWDKAFLRSEIQSVRNVQTNLNVRIFVGEFSAAAYAPGADLYLNDLCAMYEEYGWDWCYHAFREATCWSLEHEGASYYELQPTTGETARMGVIKRYLRNGRRPLVIQIR